MRCAARARAPSTSDRNREADEHQRGAGQQPRHVGAQRLADAQLREDAVVDAGALGFEHASSAAWLAAMRSAARRLAVPFVRGARRGHRARVHAQQARRAVSSSKAGLVLARRVLREVVELGVDLHRAPLDLLRAAASPGAPRCARVRELAHLRAQRLEAVLHLQARDHLAVQRGLAVELEQREAGEGGDGDRRDREPAAGQALGRREHRRAQLAWTSGKAARAAANVASRSAGPWAEETKPAS
jgi:hypothetical protein